MRTVTFHDPHYVLNELQILCVLELLLLLQLFSSAGEVNSIFVHTASIRSSSPLLLISGSAAIATHVLTSSKYIGSAIAVAVYDNIIWDFSLMFLLLSPKKGFFILGVLNLSKSVGAMYFDMVTLVNARDFHGIM